MRPGSLKARGRFTMEWYRAHPITKELLNSCVLNGKVLDIGCGTGHRSFIAHEQNECDMIGIDGSAYAIRYAKKNFSPSTLSFLVGNITSMCFQDKSFDNAFMLAVIEHVLHTNSLLSEIKRVVVPGGRLFLCVTENNYHASPDHIHIFSEISLRKTFQSYKIIKSFVSNHIIFMTIEMPS